MGLERWRQVEQIYHAALEKAPNERTSFLEQRCAGDLALREEIESLLRFADDADSYLSAAVGEVASEASGDTSAAPSEQDMVTRAATKLGRYQLVEQIGKGGMGVVYRAIDPIIGRAVAIKTILLDDAAESAEFRARLVRECQAAGRLLHPNIVTVHDVDDGGKTAYIVMEYVSGHTLEQVMRVDPSACSIEKILRIVQECAAALDYAHGRGVIHRDIKPANIMLDAAGTVKIADFGIAKIARFSPLTQTANIMGSPHYMAPEQWKGELVTSRTDQYALAAVAFVMLTGRRPFESDTIASLAAQTLYREPPPATTHNAKLGAAVDEVLRKALAKNPGARYDTCCEFAASLSGALQDPRAASSHPSPALPARARLPWPGIAVAAGLVTVLAGLWVYHDRTRNDPIVATNSKQSELQSPSTASDSVSGIPAKLGPPPGTPKVDRNAGGDSYTLGATSLKRGEYAKAVTYFSKAIATSPDYRSYFGRAGAHQRLEHPEQAIEDYSQAILRKPDSAMSYHGRAVCEALLKRDNQAFNDYNEALKLDPENPRTWNGRGVIYLRRKDYGSAIPDFAEAIRLDPGFVQAYENRARARRALGDAIGAEADLDRARTLKQQPHQ